jgi:hypothetical protein
VDAHDGIVTVMVAGVPAEIAEVVRAVDGVRDVEVDQPDVAVRAVSAAPPEP